MPVSTQIQFKRDTAANWTSNNPVLERGELGIETDTGKFKLGIDLSTVWTSLPYAGLIGQQSSAITQNFGSGIDGNATLSSGTLTIGRDMYWNNLTINGTGTLVTNGYKVFVAGTLDISAAMTGAITNNGNNGTSTNTQTGGNAGANTANVTVGNGTAGTAGATGAIGAGVQAAASVAGQNGGSSNIAGASGAGGPNASPTSGAAGQSGTTVVNPFPINRFETELLRGASLILGGSGGPGGSAGSGDGSSVVNSCGGGGGGSGGGIVAIWANIINRGASTATSAIQVIGGVGGNGRNGVGSYVFGISTGSHASIGATYTSNGQTFIVTTALISSATTFNTHIISSGVPTNTGTLTLASGTGSSTISYSVVSASSNVAAATAGTGGGGGGSGGGGGWIYIQYGSLTGSTATNALDASGGNGGVGGNGANNYTFTTTAGPTASVGATFTNNSQTFYVTTALTGAQTTLVTVGTGAPSASGTLTKANGTSSGNITFSSSTKGTTGAGANGGSGGNGGRITLLNITNSTGSDTFTGTGSTGGSASGIFGGNLGAGATNQVSI